MEIEVVVKGWNARFAGDRGALAAKKSHKFSCFAARESPGLGNDEITWPVICSKRLQVDPNPGAEDSPTCSHISEITNTQTGNVLGLRWGKG